MQQVETEENAAYEAPSTSSYDDLFPALPESATTVQNAGQGNVINKMRVGSSVVTQVFRVPFEERKFDHSEKFGEGESTRTCLQIMKDTGASIEISSSKDQSLTFLVTGKPNEVLEARRKILNQFQTQASRQISIPVEHHRAIIGKGRLRLKELEKQTATKIFIPNMNDGSDLVTITGSKEGIEKAEHELRIWSEEQSRKAFERISIPRIYHPFILGPYNETLNSIIEQTGTRINVPPISFPKDEIIISGEKEGVMAAKAKIESIYKEMEEISGRVSVEVAKEKHKYVMGLRGSNIAEILKETNVSVEIPPSSSAIGTITLRGPHANLGIALNKVYEKANSVVTTTVDVPAWLHKYIIGRKGANIKELTKDLPQVRVEFTDKDEKIKIEGPPEEIKKAQMEIENVAKELKFKFTFVEITVDPKHCKHIIGKSGTNINRLKDETGVVINISENVNNNTIHIEGTKEGVAAAKKEIDEMISKLENEIRREIPIDQRVCKDIIGARRQNIKEIREMFNQVTIKLPALGEPSKVQLRGPKDEVDKCAEHLIDLAKQINENLYSAEVPIYKHFHKFVIGKGGANISKIRDETQTKIDIPAEEDNNELITITGKKENVEEAKVRIQKIQNELEEIAIPSKLHTSLIGSKGKLINSIMEDCRGVTINFPPSDAHSDKVIIRGSKDEDVKKAKKQLLDLVTECELSRHVETIRAKKHHFKFIIGKNGANIKRIRDSTGTKIEFPNEKDEEEDTIKIIGKKEAVAKAKAELEAMIEEVNKKNECESEMIIEQRHHRHFVARRGEVLQKITSEFDVSISFPRTGIQSDVVVLKGTKEAIELAKARMQEIVTDLEAVISIDCIIPQKHHRFIIGVKGCKVQALSAEHSVSIRFPVRETQDTASKEDLQVNGNDNGEIKACDTIRISGKEANCLAAKQALLDLVPISSELSVPQDMQRSLRTHKTRPIRELMYKHDVNITFPNDESDMVKIVGSPANVEKAKEAILERCKDIEAERLDAIAQSFKIIMEVNPNLHAKLIGYQGKIISKIRTDHKVQIICPKKGDVESNEITIIGYEENAKAAEQDILKIVNEFNEVAKEEIHLDSRVHDRIIGPRGRYIHRIMNEYDVDVKIPRKNDASTSLVIITGSEANVSEAKDYILNLEKEYLQDLDEMYRPMYKGDGDDSQQHPEGFVVKGGPWEQTAPNTESVEEFPSFGPRGGGAAPESQNSSPITWGPRR